MKNRHYLVFLLLLLNTFFLKAQEWAWLQTIRPGGNEYCWDLATDLDGNVFATGRVKGGSTLFGWAPNTKMPPWHSTNETDIFLAKYRPNGEVSWVRRPGGKWADWGRGLDTDNQGNVYLAGDYCDTAQFGTFQVIGLGGNLNRNIFLAKYDSLGNCLWVRTAGNADASAKAHEVTVDTAGNVYITGWTNGLTDFDGIKIGILGKSLGFVAKYSSAGTIQWVKMLTSDTFSQGNGIKFSNGALYVTGDFKGKMTLDGINYMCYNYASTDVFTFKMDSDGNFIWVKVAIGNGAQESNGIDLDENENVYVTGNFVSSFFFGTTAIVANGTNSDAFVAKYDANGTFKWVKRMGGTGIDSNKEICIQKNSTILVAGQFQNNGTVDTISVSGNSISNSIVACFDSSGTALWYKLGGGVSPGWNAAFALAVDTMGNIFTGGEFSTNITMGSTTVNIPTSNGIDAFIAKLLPPINPVITANNRIICTNNSVNFNAFQDGTPITYKWLFPGATPDSSNIANPTVAYGTSGIYNVQLIVSNGLETDTTILQNYIYVNSPSSLSSINLGADTAICQGQTLLLDAGPGLINYSWNTGSSSQTKSVTSANSYIVIAQNGCGTSFSDTIAVTVNSLPMVNLGTDTTICQGNTLQLEAGIAMSSYLWSDASTNQTLTVSASGEYWVNVSDANCDASDTIQVTFEVCTDIAESFNDDGIHLFPNPATDQITIIKTTANDATLKLYNYLGEEVMPPLLLTNNQVQLNISGLEKGIYIYRIDTFKHKYITGKLIIQ